MGTRTSPPDISLIASRLIGSRGLHEFSANLSRELSQAVHCDIGAFYLYSESTKAFAPVSDLLTNPNSPGFVVGQLSSTGTLKEAVVQSGRAMMENNLAVSPWAEKAVLQGGAFHNASVMVAPVTVARTETGPETRTLAVMAAIAAGETDAFTEQDRVFMDRLGGQLGSVLQAVMAAEERDALVEINRTVVVGSMTIEELMPVVRDVLKRIIRQDMTSLVRFVRSPEGPWFDIRYRDGVDIDLQALRQFPFEQMAPAEMMATGKPLLLTGYNQDRFVERHYIESIGILSCVLCPLNVREAPYGFLAIGSRRRNAFSDRDLRLAEQVGIQLSHAIANLDAYDEIRSLKEQLERENVYLRDEINASIDLKELIGDSRTLQKTLKAIEQVAPTDSTVLILGETGTGKELAAKAIHQLSSRKDRPLVTVNCAALPPTLIESELFGHEKGAFTSAAARKIGRFEVADGGTIVLDEIGELPLDLQAKLLRVLESHEFQRVGGSQTIKLNLRVVASTNVDLAQAVKQGTFRSDLYYRLNVFPVRLPPLRERREDIPALVRHFVKKYGARHRKSVTRVGQDTLKALSSFDWPGNVRELEHVIERAVIVSQGTRLIVDEFEAKEPGHDQTSPRTLAEAERRHILDVLRQTNWVLAGKYGAASRLGMKRSTLQHRMKKLGIRRVVPRPK